MIVGEGYRILGYGHYRVVVKIVNFGNFEDGKGASLKQSIFVVHHSLSFVSSRFIASRCIRLLGEKIAQRYMHNMVGDRLDMVASAG